MCGDPVNDFKFPSSTISLLHTDELRHCRSGNCGDYNVCENINKVMRLKDQQRKLMTSQLSIDF